VKLSLSQLQLLCASGAQTKNIWKANPTRVRKEEDDSRHDFSAN
jgi:hypothetical protein